MKDINVTRERFLTPKAKHLYKRVINSNNKLGRMAKRLKSFKDRLTEAEKLAKSPKFENLMDAVNSQTYNFILSQVRTQKQKPKARRFSLDEKLLALTILKASGKGYRLLSKIFSLPSKQTLNKMLNKIPLRPGINKHLFETMKKTVQKMKSVDRHAVLLFDEVAIGSLLAYDSRADEVKGVADFGVGKRFPKIADYANVFMLKGVFRQWKQPICFTFSEGPTKSATIKYFIRKIIQCCHKIGLTILATICDQGAPNQSAINQLIAERKEHCLKQGVEDRYEGFLVDNAEVIPLYDVPHLFKGIRNNLLNKDLHFDMDNKAQIAKWDHIEQLYFLDNEDDVRLCPKLTDEHVIRRKIKKMRVSCCTQVFSYQVGAYMKKILSWGKCASPTLLVIYL